MLVHQQPEPKDPTRVVILGMGFIGRALQAALTNLGIDVVAPPRSSLDLLDADAGDRLAALLRPTDSVVFLAAITPDRGRGWKEFTQNIQMATSVCGALQRQPPAHVMYFSSDAVYSIRENLIDESTPTEPDDLYGVMHRSREMLVAAAVAPTPVAILRPTLVYGLEDTHNAYGPNRFRRMALEERRIVLYGLGEDMRDHVYIDDVSRIAVLALRHRSAGVVNIASGRSIRYQELAEMVRARFGTDVQVVTADRRIPLTHRMFDVRDLLEAFPQLSLTSVEVGLQCLSVADQ